MDKERSIEETPTWAVSVVCFILIIVCLTIEGCLHKLTEILEKKRRKSLEKALAKTKTEMMKYGFISILLTISQVRVSKICVREGVANSFLPCGDYPELASRSVSYGDSDLDEAPPTNRTASDVGYCEAKGMVSLISSEGLNQLNIFISFLAVFHILYYTLTVGLGMAKMRRWKRWEDETQTLEYQIANDSSRFRSTGETLVGKRHLKYWSNYSPSLWMVCFIRQFYGSVSKEDYFTLRNGFIAANISEGSNFNFMKFLSRTYDEDFEKIVRIRSWIWIFNILFIFLCAHVFHSYYWLPFIPLVVAVVAGTKLQVIITNMCVDSCKERPVIKGTLLVRPSDDYFWLRRPEWLLHLLQLILIQNSFQLAFFTWTWYKFGPRSCFNREVQNIAIRIVMGVATQLLCGYETLPLYALVTQMGSGMRRAVFTELVAQGLKNWHKRAKQSLSNNNSSVSARPSTSVRSRRSDDNNSARGTTVENMKNPTNDEEPTPHLDSSSVFLSPPSATTTGNGEVEEESTEHTHNEKEITNHSNITTSEITTVEEEKYKNKIIATVSCDGEISFGRSSWKNNMSSISSRGTGEIISSIITEEENDRDIYLS